MDNIQILGNPAGNVRGRCFADGFEKVAREALVVADEPAGHEEVSGGDGFVESPVPSCFRYVIRFGFDGVKYEVDDGDVAAAKGGVEGSLVDSLPGAADDAFDGGVVAGLLGVVARVWLCVGIGSG